MAFEDDGAFGDIGAALGEVGAIALALVYSRTLLKIVLQKGSIMERLAPLEADFQVKSLLQRLLFASNRAHPYLGAIAIVSIYLHHYLVSSASNVFLDATLVVLAWQGLVGVMLKFKYTPAFLKKRTYLIHAELYSGVLLVALAILGHSFVDD